MSSEIWVVVSLMGDTYHDECGRKGKPCGCDPIAAHGTDLRPAGDQAACGMFKRYWWVLFAIAPVGMMAGFLVAAVVTYVMPKKYESSLTMEIKPASRSVMDAGIQAPAQNYLATEFNKIKSRNSLMGVVDSLDLVNKWGLDRESALQILRQIVRTENIRGTDLFTIHVRHTNREDARDIAAEVARAYGDYRMELESKSVGKMVNELKKAVREQEDKVEERRKVLETIARTMGASEPLDKQDYVDAKRDYETDLALLEQLKLRLITEEITRNSESQAIVIHDEPVIAEAPVSPNVTLNLVLGLAGGLLLSPFLSLPLMFLMNRRSRAVV
ncbi:hypothetical protein HZ994_03300 [Akkermansiaceae bacterium]|nr:hypothetical protein HZ994_03300 [Akkermansiaceae bacterium]